MTKSNQYLLIMALVSFALPILFLIQLSGADYIDGIIHDGFNHLLRPLIFFLVFEPFVFLWKKYVRKQEMHKFLSNAFIDNAVETLFVYWIIFTVLFLPGYPIWLWF
jgi:hypothetical protein